MRTTDAQVRKLMGKQADGLSALVQGSLMQQPKSGHLFVFFSRKKDFVRILFWDANGYCTKSTWDRESVRGARRSLGLPHGNSGPGHQPGKRAEPHAEEEAHYA